MGKKRALCVAQEPRASVSRVYKALSTDQTGQGADGRRARGRRAAGRPRNGTGNSLLKENQAGRPLARHPRGSSAGRIGDRRGGLLLTDRRPSCGQLGRSLRTQNQLLKKLRPKESSRYFFHIVKSNSSSTVVSMGGCFQKLRTRGSALPNFKINRNEASLT